MEACAAAARPPTGKKMKARAPPPPGTPAVQSIYGEQKPPHDAALGSQQSLVHMKKALQNSPLDITVVLPNGLERQSVVSGSHAVMDLLVELCLQNHLNPSHHVLEIWSSESQEPLSFKPNTLVGSLNVHTVFLKEKVPEEKVKPGFPKVPEKSVRLVVNYLRTQKAVVRVSPDVPLQNILPIICAKCEVSPEHIVLLRDSIAGEELQLSKSLNELGIKELYAWDNRRETFRKSSLDNDEMDKDKKKIMGFFKVNKRSNSKVEHLWLSGTDSDEDASKSVSEKATNGCLTTPNSPSMHSGSLTLGPSLSLGNISGVTMKSEMKKRRAPPPPSPRLLSQDKASEKASLSSQVDLQKKKRQAPAPPLPPPPPSPVVLNRSEDREKNRKSTMGVGRQVPQKPPRGATRGLPQLVLPPPPPYPPPGTDVAEPVSFPGEGAGSKTSELRPKLSLSLDPGSLYSMDVVPQVLPEAEETASVGSCFASEDTTEDSGVMSSPSDIISLDSQHDSTKSKDKWSTDQEDCSDQDLAATPELGPPKRTLYQRTEKSATSPHNDEDLLIAEQFQQTLAELDEDLEEMEESYEIDTTGSLSNSINGVSNHCLKQAIIPVSDTDAIPVTFIGEVSDDPVDSGLFSSINNNAGSFDMGPIGSQRANLSPQQTEYSQPYVRTMGTGLGPSPPSQNIRKGIQGSFANTSEDKNPVEIGPTLTSSASRLCTHEPNAQKSNMHGSAHIEKMQAIHRVNSQPMSQKDSEDKNLASVLPPWSQRDQAPGGSYGLKCGLTTYKIIPPKSEMRCYDRGVSLSTGAIKIDELGNLVSPHMNGSRTISQSSAVIERETQTLGKVKEFWRYNSMERHMNQLADCLAQKNTTTTTTAAPGKQQGDNWLKAAPTMPTPQQQSSSQDHEAHLEDGRSQQPSSVTRHLRVPIANTSEVTFFKPQRRTSSQYMASAIAKRIGSLNVHTDVARPQEDASKGHEVKGPKLAGPLSTLREDAPTNLSEAQQHERDMKQPVYLPQNPRAASPVGDHLREEVSNPCETSSTRDCPAALHRSSCFLPVTSSQKDRVSVGQSSGFNKKPSAGNQKASSASGPMHTLHGEYLPSPHLAEVLSSRRAMVNGSVWAPGNSEPPRSPKESFPTSHIILETEKKLHPLPTDVQDTDGTSHSIFGPKKKFKPVVQRPVPKDTSMHSALMEAIHTSGGKNKLRKTAESTLDGRPKKLSYMETESERSALLAAIRGHSGTHSLRKVCSLASEELQSFRDAALLAPRLGNPQQEDTALPPPPTLPTPPALPPPTPMASQDLSASRTASRFNMGTLSNPGDARQALMDAIRSGTGAARLRKVPLLV